MRRKKETMTAAELAATRERLGWSRERLSEEVGLLPAEVEALEAGSFPVPAETAKDVRMLVAFEERQDILRASGLAECARLGAMEAGLTVAVQRGDDDARAVALEAMHAHQEACPTCRARAAYLDAHASPLPPMQIPLWMRALGWLAGLADRLPAPLRPPPGARGEYRRFGIVMGAYLTTVASVIIGIGAVVELVTGNAGEPSALEVALTLPLLAVAYLAGGYVAGAAWDATRRIRHRFIGYVLRGGGTAAAMYGAMMLMLPAEARRHPGAGLPGRSGCPDGVRRGDGRGKVDEGPVDGRPSRAAGRAAPRLTRPPAFGLAPFSPSWVPSRVGSTGSGRRSGWRSGTSSRAPRCGRWWGSRARPPSG